MPDQPSDVSYERSSVRALEPYVPGAQPQSARAVKLNTNENPYPPSEAVMRALREVPAESLRRYPPPAADVFRDAAAELHGLQREQVIAVNGGDELLRLALTTFVDPGRPLGVLQPAYSLYPVLARIHGSEVYAVPCREDASPPPGAAERLNRAGAQLTFLVNPNAPTGQLLPASSVIALAEQLEGVLLVDEAYVDFVDPSLAHDLTRYVERQPNLMLLRTLSKGYALAGLRLGYGLASRASVAALMKTRDSYNVDAIAQRVGAVALQHRDDAAESWRKVREERERLLRRVRSWGLEAYDSQSNFVLVRVPDAPRIHAELGARDIHVRHFDADGLRDRLRVTIGTPEQNQAFLNVLQDLLRL